MGRGEGQACQALAGGWAQGQSTFWEFGLTVAAMLDMTIPSTRPGRRGDPGNGLGALNGGLDDASGSGVNTLVKSQALGVSPYKKLLPYPQPRNQNLAPSF